MSRPTFPRSVGFLPGVTYFKPAGVKIADLKEVVLGHDEIEAMRLKNLQCLSQEEAAGRMNVSQPTLHRLLSSAYLKITDAIVNGKALRIEGGSISVSKDFSPGCDKGRMCARNRRGAIKTKAGEGQAGVAVTKIAITSSDGTMEGAVSERFGRAVKLVVYDTESGGHEVVENGEQMNLAQGAGIETAQKLIDLGVKAVISGHVGPNAYGLLENAGIEVFGAADMTAADAVKKYREGLLVRLPGADVPGRW
jgi:predicted DNA-binding protein (UPF0251 family)/predicted Fe-Mo cluster-binding NifX family protein